MLTLTPNRYVPPGQYQAHYPIITPPVPIPFCSQFQPLPVPQCPPNLYQPNYMKKPQERPKARFTEIGSEEQGVEVVQAAIDSVVTEENDLVCDTGSRYSLTGDREDLHSFCFLTKPIPISLATKQPGRHSHVIGVGSLLYPGLNGQKGVNRGVYFCHDATCTLISLGDLRSTGKRFMFDKNNKILFCDENRVPTFVGSYTISVFPITLKRIFLK
ncbi:hypothetical protein O181_006150 [Austropuccinia psidii MF-1]|uniref:Uncharacterized protein n=1 Tax=Austropuccinia psidii MF-1 TaxID=1389203 RepID=A0A9Q3GGJ6_9BASI|nr:hypothetical protein [Austropuccinia psidii MF-1]